MKTTLKTREKDKEKILKDTVSVNAPIEFEWQDIANLLCGAIEGGSNYWYMVVKSNLQSQRDCDYLSMLPAYEKGWFNVQDLYANECGDNFINGRKTMRVNRKVLLKGLHVMSEKYPRHFTNFRTGDYDAITSDVFFQCCVFGEIIYG